MHMRSVVLSLCLSLLAACGAPIPPWSAPYAQQVSTRSYADIAPDRVAAAAQEVLRLAASPRDISIKPEAAGFRADRYFTAMRGLQSLSGDYRFSVTVADQGKGSRIAVKIMDLNGFDGPATPFSLTVSGQPVQYAAPYDLFFARLDYLLGRRPNWISCAQAPAELHTQLPFDALCLYASDRRPIGPLPG